MRQFTFHTLPNGLRVLFVPRKESFTTTVMVSVTVGSKHETKEINGISHFLEHMCFKGTEKRPTSMHIASELDGLGAQYNAFTSQESTSYYAKVKNEFLPQALDVISDIYLHPVFSPAEIEKEKGVIVEEINMYEDMPSRRVQELFMELVYGDQPAGWGIAGRKDVVRGLQQKDFIDYRSKHYIPASTVVAVSGGFDSKLALKEIHRHFGALAKKRQVSRAKVREKQLQPKELISFKDSDQTHLVLGFRAFSFFDRRKYALKVLADILGGGMSSRLFHKIREELGAAYYVRASDDLYSDHGIFEMSSGAQHAKVTEVISAMLQECGRLTKELVSPSELRKVKDHLVGSMFLSLETSEDIAYFYAGQEIAGLPLSNPSEVGRRISLVTAEDVRAVARALFRDARLNLAMIAPFKNKSFKDILSVK
ncbi:hypothetical protein A3A21_02360 [Candidatus Jorgensenbacteria bacterium RIFCSPLOWO2_01_FULL_45_25b]|uniref:Peptidase M16 n=1 Tax=Candidatus Jorgensenbacteria bacterium RIFCSPLOWO2_01_FULL_45_25b TaxID=1798471 RepID=A0A1F6BSG4_9BACT|nr:MAG: hypothetical protein A3A21_02360 [Candidatus Jorgensenbacteria bacterium RIFCSPLOWO2_01_FULL_45_25b]